MLAVLGEPGSGKSTLLHTLGCLQRADSGSLDFEGRDVTQLTDVELAELRTHKVGFIFQAFNTLTNETLLANVEVPLRAQGYMSWDWRERAEEALRGVGLGDALERRPGQLTQGQRQCLSIARAEIHKPAVIFADEPTQDIDISSRDEVLGLLQRLNDEGKTVVIATGDAEVAQHCHRVMKMASGKMVAISRVESRTIVPPDRIPMGAARASDRVVIVCSRCDYGNFEDQLACSVCAFPLDLTQAEERAVERRLSGADGGALGVESRSDEGGVPVPKLVQDLKEIPFFSGLGSKNLLKVIPTLEQRHFDKGSTILKQGDPGDFFYMIREGKAQVVLERDGAPSSVMAELGPGEGFGEMALLTNQPRSATVIALSDVETWGIPKDAFEVLVSENLSLGLHFNRILSQRLRSLQDRLVP